MQMVDKRLQDKVAIVTGAGSRGVATGTGYAISVLLARHGARVVLADIDEDRAETTLRDIEAEGGEAMIFEANMTQEVDCQALVEACMMRYGSLHILVNNVGPVGYGMVTEIEAEAWNRTLDVNLNSMVWASKYAIPSMAETGGGSIINIASIDGLRAGAAQNAPYSVVTGGVITLIKAMAVHHGRDQIRYPERKVAALLTVIQILV